MPSVAARTAAVVEGGGDAPWPGHEYVRGRGGVFGLPFDSGHVLALRVSPQSSVAPYRTVWHRDPGGRWSSYAEVLRGDIACPRIRDREEDARLRHETDEQTATKETTS